MDKGTSGTALKIAVLSRKSQQGKNYNFYDKVLFQLQKFLGQGSNMSHISNPSHCSDNAKSLTVGPLGTC